jgi:uncharacterized protein YlaI
MNDLYGYVKPLFFVLFLISLHACQLSQKQEYNDYFFQSQKKSHWEFNYVLYMGKKSDHIDISNNNIDIIEELPKREHYKNKPIKTNEADSLAFRMEEKAYQRLQKKLSLLPHCQKKIKYTFSQYTWLKYTIKGICL